MSFDRSKVSCFKAVRQADQQYFDRGAIEVWVLTLASWNAFPILRGRPLRVLRSQIAPTCHLINRKISASSTREWLTENNRIVRGLILLTINNMQEHILLSPSVVRKTCCETHSEQGAKTAAILFSLVETS